jgi:two-component system sensor histidine kinase KdpD
MVVGGSLSARRRAYGYAMAVLGAALLVAVLVPLRGRLDLASDALLFLLLVVSTAILGGLGPALVACALGSVSLNFFFTEPFHTLRIRDSTDIVAILVFASVAVMVSWVVDLAARRASAAREAAELEAGNRLRTALLAAVGHDLRTPLATAKAVVSGLRSRDVTLDDSDRQELLETADDALDRLAALVDNLLDLSRLQAGALPVRTKPVPLEDIVAAALDDLGVDPLDVVVDVPEEIPDVVVDPGLLERVIVNLVANAQRHASEPPLLSAALAGERVELRVIDTGPGIAVSDRDRVFVPFQRLGDISPTGLGLGLALSRGLVEAMAGTLRLDDTAGGGLTVTISLPAAPAAHPASGVS